jgi:hypothetical protein
MTVGATDTAAGMGGAIMDIAGTVMGGSAVKMRSLSDGQVTFQRRVNTGSAQRIPCTK